MIPKIETTKIVDLPTKADLIKYWDTQTNFNKILKKELEVGKSVYAYDKPVTIKGFTESGLVSVVDANGTEGNYDPSNIHLKIRS